MSFFDPKPSKSLKKKRDPSDMETVGAGSAKASKPKTAASAAAGSKHKPDLKQQQRAFALPKDLETVDFGDHETMQLKDKEGKLHTIFRKSASLSLTNAIDASQDEVHFAKVPTETMRVIAAWLNIHESAPVCKIPRPIPSGNMSDFVKNKKDVALMESLTAPQAALVMTMSNSMGIKGLVDLGLAKFAVTFYGRSPDEIQTSLTGEILSEKDSIETRETFRKAMISS